MGEVEEEVICDPENPACSLAPVAPEAPPGGEVICDPENPACTAPPEEPAVADPGEDVICDPENPACVNSSGLTPSLTPPILSTTQALAEEDTFDGMASFAGQWGTSLALDLAREGQGEDVVEWGTGVDLSVQYTQGATMKVVLQGEFRHWVGITDTSDGANGFPDLGRERGEFLARLGESYVSWQKGQGTLRAGHLITPWGSTDLVRPGDVLNPRDFRTFGWVEPAQGDGVLPQLALELGWAGAGWGVQGVLIPFYKPDAQVFFGRDVGVLRADVLGIQGVEGALGPLEEVLGPSAWEQVQVLLSAPRYPDETGLNPAAGARATATVANTDLGLGYAWAWDRTPYVSLRPGTLTTLPQVAYEIKRRQTLVADLSRYLGRVGVRADLAWSPAQTFLTDELRSIRRPSLFGALGLSFEDVTGDRAFGAVLEGFVLHPFGAQSAWTKALVPQEERGVEEDEILIYDAMFYGLATALTWDLPWVKRLRFLGGGVWNVSSRDGLARAGLSWQPYEQGVTWSLGAQWFQGPPPHRTLYLRRPL